MVAKIMTKGGATTTTRRWFIVSLAAASGIGAVPGGVGVRFWIGKENPFRNVANAVIPRGGYKTAVSFGDSILRLVAAGVVDPEKFRRLYEARGGLPAWVDRLFAAPSDEPITFKLETAPYLLNLLWPLGLSTKAVFNARSPLNGVRLPSFASTAGWRLGREKNGSVYFNQVETVRLDDAQEKVVFNIARNVFRPCCDNSAFFQDCNHGSALLGLLELAAFQGVPPEELYRIALVANSYWYPSQYVETALYFKMVDGRSWDEVPPQTILGKRFSSASGWRRNIHARLQDAFLLPRSGQKGQGGCGV